MPPSATSLVPAAASGGDLTGLSGWVADVIAALGAWGVGFLTLLETVFPPIPSEIVLPLAGFLSQQGRMGLLSVLVASTSGSLIGAWLLYWMGAALGSQRSARLLGRLPLVGEEDVHEAEDWFRRHGRSAVFFGRLVPGVRSLISLPAGTARMPVATFTFFTLAGSAVWNCLLVGLGYGLGTQWQRVEQYAQYLDYLVIGALVVVVLLLVRRQLRKRRAAVD